MGDTIRTFNKRSGLPLAVTATATLILGSSWGTLARAEPAEGVEEVIVWGTTVRSDLLSLDQDEIALRQADHLSDLLRVVPGVDIGGTHSVNSRINIRGLDDRELDIYIDGALQTNYLYHHLGNLLINADILQSADIQVGANSVTSGGIGGVVRFQTKTAADLLAGDGKSAGARLMASYNDNAQTAFSGTAYAEFDTNVDALAYFHQVDRDNFEDGSGRSTIGSDGLTNNLLLKLGFNLSDVQRVQVSFDRLDDSGDYTQRPDMGVLTNQAITGDLLLPTDYERETVNVSYSLDLADRLNLQATYFTNDMELTRDERDPAVRTQTGNTLKRARADNQGLNALAVSMVTTGALDHTLRYGFQAFEQDLAFYPDLVLRTAPTKQSARSLALFVEDEIVLPAGVILRPGVRFATHEVEYKSTGEEGSFDDITFGLAGEWEVVDGLRLLVSYLEIFQAPELAEPFSGDGANKIVNPGLEAESGENLEGGFRFRKTLSGVEIALGGNYFQTTIDGYIAEADVPGTTTGETWDLNLGEIVIEGFEASAMVTWKGWDFFLSHNKSDFDTSGLTTAAVSDSFREVGDTTSYEVAFNWDRYNAVISLNGQFIGDKVTSLGLPKASYAVHNLQMRWDEPLGAEGFAITAGVDNLLDETYTSHASRVGSVVHPVFGSLVLNDVEPGRNIKLTLSKRF